MDTGHQEADNELKRIERKLRREYSKAYREMKEKADAYFAQFQEEDQIQLQLLNTGKITQAEYIQWRTTEMLTTEQYKEMTLGFANEMSNTNQRAMDMINHGIVRSYVENYNFAGYEICNATGMDIAFGLVDDTTIERLLAKNPRLLPKVPHAKLNRTKDEQWNTKKVRSALTQGILQGDSIPNLAKRLQSVAKMNNTAATRNARTMVTGAENAGRLDRYEEARELGIDMQKTWLATTDTRTRDAHIELDGVSVDVDKPFENSVGKIRFPGDPNADGDNVYNCRCTLIGAIKGFERDFSNRDMSKLNGMTYEEWKASVKQKENDSDPNPDKLDQKVLDIVGKKGKPIPPTQLIDTINPNWPKKGYTDNCQRCAVCYELGRRGYDVEALPFDGSYPNGTHWWQLNRWFRNDDNYLSTSNKKYKINRMSKTCANSITQAMTDWGDGARATLGITWRNNDVGHIINVENINGKIMIFDTQNGTMTSDIEKYLSKTKCEDIELLRSDLAPFRDDINDPWLINNVLKKVCKKRGT